MDYHAESNKADYKEYPGGLKRVGEPPCIHPEHNPPGMMVYQPGVYDYTCPGCGHVTRFQVNGFTC